MCEREPRIEIQCATQPRLCGSPIPLTAPAHVAGGMLCFRQVGIGAHRVSDCLLRPRQDLAGRRIAVQLAPGIRIGDGDPGERVVGILRGCLTEVVDRASRRFRGAAAREHQAAEVQIVGLGIPRLSAREGIEPLGREPEPDLLGDRCAQFPLQPQHADGFPIERFRPDLHLIARTNQPGGDAHATAFGAERGFDQVVGAQLAADFGRRFRGAPVTQRRRAGDDREALGIDLAQHRDHFLRQALCEIVPIGIATQVGEWQYRDRHRGGRLDPPPHKEEAGNGNRHQSKQAGGDPRTRRANPARGRERAGGRGGCVGRVGRRCRGNRCARHGLDLADEAVSPARDSLDKHRIVARIAQRLSNLANRGVDARVDVDKDVFSPEPVDDLGAGDELPPVLDEQNEQVHRLPFEANRPSVATQLAGAKIELEVAESKRLAGLNHRGGQAGGPTIS